MIRTILALLILTIFGVKKGNSQNNIPIGSWRTHFALQSLNTLDYDGDNTILAGSTSGLVKFDIEEKSFETLSKIDGFSDIEVTDIKYHKQLKLWVIGYASGNIDILKGNKVTNLNVIVRSTTITGSKQINEITFHQNNAYLSTDFGVVLLNLSKLEITETYSSIGPDAAMLTIYSSAIFNDSLYIATNEGLRVASMADNINKIDYRNWSAFAYANSAKPTKLIAHANSLIASDLTQINYYKNKAWTNIGIPFNGNQISNMNTYHEYLFVFSGSVITKIQPNFSYLQTETNSSPSECIIDKFNSTWFSDLSLSLRKINSQGTQFTNYQPNSPINQSSFRLKYLNNKIFCTSGGYNQKASAPTATANTTINGIYVYENGNWTNYAPIKNNYPDVRATLDICYNPFTKSYYAAGFKGLVKFNEGQGSTVYNSLNSPIIDLAPPYQFIFNYGIDCDKNGTVWAAFSERIPPSFTGYPTFQSLSAKGVWSSYVISGLGAKTADLLIEPTSNDKWLRMAVETTHSGILVFNEKNPAGLQYRLLNSETNKGGLASATVYCMAMSQSGDMWIGTSKGVNIISNASSVLKYSSNRNFYAVNATVPVYDSRALLRDKVVTVIKADGGDRKWIATTEGLWLFSPDGSEQLAFFDMDNSPLPSNNILSIEIEGETGEVFVATDKGIVSYRSNATTGEKNNNGNVKVFPNPVRPDYSGPIAISGLVNQAVVKITDITGVLIFQTIANGGMATWYGNNMNGQKVAPGVYLIFSSDAHGESGLVSKVAVLD